MRLCLGCGPFPAPPPWHNVDADALPGVDTVADVGRLPFPPASVDAIYAGHILEHIPLHGLGTVLGEWRRVLRPGAPLMVVGPDIDRAIRLKQEVDPTLEEIIAYGDPPKGHAWTCSEGVLRYLLEVNGWECRSIPIESVNTHKWPVTSQAAWQVAILAR